MGKWLDRLKSHTSLSDGGFVSFGSSTTGHIAERKPDLEGFVSFGSSTTGHFHKSATLEFEREGIKRLREAAQGVPATLEELQAFFADDLQEFGQGRVKQAGIVQAVRWYAYQYKGMEEPRLEEIPAGMVRCIDCLQNRCTYRQVTPYGNVVMQSSPAWRWCDDYTARVHNLDDYRRR